LIKSGFLVEETDKKQYFAEFIGTAVDRDVSF
jgi:hypothetical protein